MTEFTEKPRGQAAKLATVAGGVVLLPSLIAFALALIAAALAIL